MPEEAPYFVLKLAPRPSLLHVDIRAVEKPTTSLRLARGSVRDLRALTIADASGPIAFTLADAVVTLAHAAKGELRVSYDVPASSDARAPTAALVVADDRFRGLGESFVLWPELAVEERANVTLDIDGSAIRAPTAASSFGNGPHVTRRAFPHSLVKSMFVAGSLGVASFSEIDTDRAAWLGYTSFDPRPAVAEVAQVRTALRERWRGGGEEAFELLFVSTPRPVGSYAMVPRASSLFVHLGPSEPWSAAMRVNIAQHLVHGWIGGELRMVGSDAETAWFHDGFARYLGAKTLSDLGLLRPDEAQAYVLGLLSVQAFSLHRGKSNAALAALAADDPKVRALLVARGALAAHVLAMRVAEQGKTLENTILIPFLERHRETRDEHLVDIDAETLVKTVSASISEKAGADLSAMLGGRDVVLPANALGPCFRSRTGDYTSFDLGFDLAATLDRDDRLIVGRSPNGPANALLEGDVLEDAKLEDGRPDVKATLTVLRKGTKTVVEYLPAGARQRGQIFDRAAIPDAKPEKCHPLL